MKLSGMHIMFVSEIAFDENTRTFREIETLLQAGANITIVTWEDDLIQERDFSGQIVIIKIPRAKTSSSNSSRVIRIALNLLFFTPLSKLKNFRGYFPEIVSVGTRLNPDIICSADLVYLKTADKIAKKCNAKLVYDSFEYWKGFLQNKVFLQGKRRVFGSLRGPSRLLRSEEKIAPRVDLLLVTSLRMRELLVDAYGICSSEIILNAPHRIKQLSSGNAESPVRLIFHGGLSHDRNISALLQAVALLPGCTLSIYGKSRTVAEKELINEAVSLGIQDRVAFHGEYSYSEMGSFLSQYDIGVYPAVASDGNFDVTLPNKLFDYICAGVVSAMPAFKSIEGILEKEEVGVILDTSSPNSIAKGLRALIDNPPEIARLKRNARQVSENYCWEAQEEKLINAFAALGVGHE